MTSLTAAKHSVCQEWLHEEGGDCQKGGKLVVWLLSMAWLCCVCGVAFIIQRGGQESTSGNNSRSKLKTAGASFLAAFFFFVAIVYWTTGCHYYTKRLLERRGAPGLGFGPGYIIMCTCCFLCVVASMSQLKGTSKYEVTETESISIDPIAPT